MTMGRAVVATDHDVAGGHLRSVPDAQARRPAASHDDAVGRKEPRPLAGAEARHVDKRLRTLGVGDGADLQPARRDASPFLDDESPGVEQSDC